MLCPLNLPPGWLAEWQGTGLENRRGREPLGVRISHHPLMSDEQQVLPGVALERTGRWMMDRYAEDVRTGRAHMPRDDRQPNGLPPNPNRAFEMETWPNGKALPC